MFRIRFILFRILRSVSWNNGSGSCSKSVLKWRKFQLFFCFFYIKKKLIIRKNVWYTCDFGWFWPPELFYLKQGCIFFILPPPRGIGGANIWYIGWLGENMIICKEKTQTKRWKNGEKGEIFTEPGGTNIIYILQMTSLMLMIITWIISLAAVLYLLFFPRADYCTCSLLRCPV